MDPRIKKQLHRSDQLFGFYTNILEDLNPEQLNFKPEKDKWSIVQIVYHLFTAETLIYHSLMNFSFDIKNEKLGLGSRIRSFLTNLMLNSTLKFKAPSSRLEQFPDEIDALALSENWKKKRNGFVDYLKKFREDKLSYRVFRHPVSGKFTLSQTLGFMNYHLKHHQRQIERIIDSENFPK
jgi:hypothetical protein